MLSRLPEGESKRLESVDAPRPAGRRPEPRLLADLGALDWLHSPPPMERLEAAVGRARLSQLLLLVALCPEEEDLLLASIAEPQAA